MIFALSPSLLPSPFPSPSLTNHHRRPETAGHVAFFGFISEFRRPEEWPKALYLLQAVDTAMYLVVAIVIYRYCGPDVKSPALGSASPLVKKIAWGIAIPTVRAHLPPPPRLSR